MSDRLSRKEFFDTSVRTAIGVSVGAWAGSLATASAQQLRQEPITLKAVQGYPWPWPYVKLDPEDLRKWGHKLYYDGGCCYGAFNAVISALAEKVGEPFTLMPPQMMYFGSGGGAGWGTLCGALNGVAAAMSLVVDRSTASSLIGELFGWYTTAKFPSDISNGYAVQRAFLVNRNDTALKQTVSSTPLCHGSVTKWCTETFHKASSPERAERCARLTGDTVARAIELLNDLKDGRFRATFVPPSEVSSCMSCHDTGYGHVLSSTKMDCRQCHDDSFDHLW